MDKKARVTKHIVLSAFFGSVLSWLLKSELTPLLLGGKSYDGRSDPVKMGIVITLMLLIALIVFISISLLVMISHRILKSKRDRMVQPANKTNKNRSLNLSETKQQTDSGSWELLKPGSPISALSLLLERTSTMYMFSFACASQSILFLPLPVVGRTNYDTCSGQTSSKNGTCKYSQIFQKSSMYRSSCGLMDPVYMVP